MLVESILVYYACFGSVVSIVSCVADSNKIFSYRIRLALVKIFVNILRVSSSVLGLWKLKISFGLVTFTEDSPSR